MKSEGMEFVEVVEITEKLNSIIMEENHTTLTNLLAVNKLAMSVVCINLNPKFTTQLDKGTVLNQRTLQGLKLNIDLQIGQIHPMFSFSQ
jgi:hypothetical protein